MSRLVVVVVLVLGTTACGSSGHRVGRAGISLEVPGRWHTWLPRGVLIHGVSDPLTRIVAASAPFHLAANDCQVAAYSFSRTAVAIVVLEWRRTYGATFPPRPRRFTARTLRIYRPPAIECFDGSGGSTEFRDQGRYLGVYVMVGRDAPPRLAGRARAVLDTLKVVPRS